MPVPPASTQPGLLTALSCKHMTSHTGTNGFEVCRKGHDLAIAVLTVFVFVCVTCLSQGHLETCHGRPYIQDWKKKKWQNM